MHFYSLFEPVEKWTMDCHIFFSLDPSSGRKLFPFPEVLHFFSIPFALN